MASVKKLSLPTVPYEQELGAVDAGAAQAGAASAGDPLGARTALEKLRVRADTLLNRIERVVSLFGDAQQVKTATEALTRQVAGHRAQGLKLVEEGGNPDHTASARRRGSGRDPDRAPSRRSRLRGPEAGGGSGEAPGGQNGRRERAKSQGVLRARAGRTGAGDPAAP